MSHGVAEQDKVRVPGEPPKIKLAEVRYDKADMFEADEVTITFNLKAISSLGYGADLILGRMDRIKEDLAFLVLEMQARRAKLANPAGPIKVFQ